MCWQLNKWSHFAGFFLHINFGGGRHCGFPGRHHLKCSMWAKTQYNCSTSSQLTACNDRCCLYLGAVTVLWLCLYPRMEAEDENRSTFSSKKFPPVQRAFGVRWCPDSLTGAVVDWPSVMLGQILVGHYIVEPVRCFCLQPSVKCICILMHFTSFPFSSY